MTLDAAAPSPKRVPELNTEKARRAAKDPDRPGEKCGAAADAYRPVVERNSCEGSATVWKYARTTSSKSE
jgi:hypothetical protein